VLGAGISTAICGSIRGSQTFEANCQAISTTNKVIKFGSIRSVRSKRSRHRLPGDTAPRGGIPADPATDPLTGAARGAAPVALGALASAPWSAGGGATMALPSGLEGLAIKGPGLG
jgi:hypothetical protein